MEITETLYISERHQWRSWLENHCQTHKEIWLIYYKKNSGKPRISYDDAVEEALCFGWIDSTIKPMDEERNAQRFSPRRKNSQLSELNKERVRRLMESGKMTQAGLDSIQHHLVKTEKGDELKEFIIPEDILQALQEDPVVWENFKQFPVHYQHIRIGFIETSRKRPDVFQQRLSYFIKMTALNKKYGMMK